MFRTLFAGAACALLVAHAAAQTETPQMRAIWIDSWSPGMLSPEQVEQMVADVRRANLNAIFPEVRKVGDSYYLRGFEPRASNIADQPEDWDPLQQMIDLCHDTSDGKQYIEVHAWMVTFRVWRGDLDDLPEGHLLREHPEVIMSNASGETSGGGSVFADPGHPITQDWTVRAYREVAANYNVDGVHFDYVRYPEYDGDWGHNPVSLQRFRERTGFEGIPEASDPAWQAWRREQVEDVVRRVYAEVHEVNPNCLVSAATLNWSLEMDVWDWQTCRPRTQAHQDWVEFMREGILDINSLMNYTRYDEQPHRYPDWTELALRTRFDRHALIGPGVFMNTVENGFDQIQHALAEGADGVNLYCYAGTNNEDVSREVYFDRLREEVFPNRAEIPTRPWIDTPNYGIAMGQITVGDEWADGWTVTLDGVNSLLTDGTGFWAFTRVAPGTHSVVVQGPGGQERRTTVTVEAGGTARADMAFRGRWRLPWR